MMEYGAHACPNDASLEGAELDGGEIEHSTSAVRHFDLVLSFQILKNIPGKHACFCKLCVAKNSGFSSLILKLMSFDAVSKFLRIHHQ